MEENNRTQEVLTSLPRQELRRMLADELHKDTETIDETLVRQLLMELQSRGTDPAFADDEAVDAACEKFRVDTENAKTPRKRWYQGRMLKVASVLLVLGILFFALPNAAEADPVGDVLGWWSDSVFQFLQPGERPPVQESVFQTDHPGLQQIYDTVTELGVTLPVVPQKLSNEYQLTQLKTLPFAEEISIYARLKNENNEILLAVIVHKDTVMLQHEKNATNIRIWDLDGVEHYVIPNKNEWIATWVIDNIECSITTDCPEEDIYELIKSIYTLEG